ncbi:MAG TPA: small ribosomal subunit Rsm22 family protein [Pseudolabrys sp.]|nr:small ribosomal subunit Rsm22 family protein [Pseudolabrys sp.]
MSALPGFVSGALHAKLENVSRTDLKARAQRMSDSYRGGGTSAVIRSDLDALAYAIVRMPATYVAVRAALAQTAQIVPDFGPRTLLDVGAGPGTATWAACDAWPSLERATLIDDNPHLLALAQAMQASLDISAQRSAMAAALPDAASADVVLASYVLTELPDASLRATLDRLWDKAERLLVIVEPGTPDGFKRILACRDALIARGAQIVAPCSHEGGCPLADGPRWCHFSARVPRSRDHLLVKDANVPFEDEKFSYLVAGKGFPPLDRGRRILATPKVDKSAVTLTVCTPDVPEQRRVARGDKDAYRAAKRLDWGDAI